MMSDVSFQSSSVRVEMTEDINRCRQWNTVGFYLILTGLTGVKYLLGLHNLRRFSSNNNLSRLIGLRYACNSIPSKMYIAYVRLNIAQFKTSRQHWHFCYLTDLIHSWHCKAHHRNISLRMMHRNHPNYKYSYGETREWRRPGWLQQRLFGIVSKWPDVG